jgi:hypothetical protein
MSKPMRQFDTAKFRITIEEVKNKHPLLDTFQVTLWPKHDRPEDERILFELETFGGACDKALNLMFDHMVPDET